MPAPCIYSTPVAPEWIDYNGHLRDGYYTVVFSSAVDALMDTLGLDESYRQRTNCTLYTLELHVHFLREVKQSDALEIRVRVLGADRKRLLAALDMYTGGSADAAATAEFMLLHVRQGPAPVSAEFPADVVAAIGRLREATAASPPVGPGSRALELRSR
jgi:acyl-CoA thioester hydrolase